MEKKTALYEKHRSLGAKITSFGGYLMPVWYKGILDEYKAVRERVGLFDLNHMGEILITGKDRDTFLNYVITNDIRKIDYNQILYTYLCNDKGLILDDLLCYSYAEGIMLIVNAGQSEMVIKHFGEHRQEFSFVADNISEKTGLLAIQGPDSFKLCQKIFNEDIEKINYYSFVTTEFEGNEVIISRTGYTGERGVEIVIDNSLNEVLWDVILSQGKEFDIEPCGLGVRDILRLEMGFPLHGHDLKNHTPVELKKSWCVTWDKKEFIGKKELLSKKEQGGTTQLTPFIITDKGIPREGYDLLNMEEKKIGIVTSGGFSPKLQKGIGLGLIDVQESQVGNEINILIRGKKVPAKITTIPFVPSHVK